jgi:hypothetical protein
MKLLSASDSPASVATPRSASGNSLRRRRHLRYPVEAEVKYQWSTRNSILGEGDGRSRDISQGGAFVLTNDPPPLGASIDLTIQLPAWQVGAAALRMEMTGEVIRVDVPPGHEQKWGFAVCSLKTLLRRLHDGELCAARKQ